MGEFLIYAVKVAVQIAVMTFFIYKVYNALAAINAELILNAIFVYAVIIFACVFLKLNALVYIMKILFIPYVIFFLVMYSGELRHIIKQIESSTRSSRRRTNMISRQTLDAVISSCRSLSEAKRGALIVLRRSDKLNSVIERDNVTLIEGRVTELLLLTIFLHDNPLHDGAVVIDGDKIIAAGCVLPLSGQSNIESTLGTRHRAALGLSEDSDAVVVVVSEETRAISVCFNSVIHTALGESELSSLIIECMSCRSEKRE